MNLSSWRCISFLNDAHFKWTWLNVVGVGLLCASMNEGRAEWQRVEIDPVFRAEGVAAADFNNDGQIDIAAGDVWYAAPNWERHEIRPVGEYFFDKGYSQCFCAWAWDINRDGWQDVILVGFPGEPFHWYENPKGEAGHWKPHVIHSSICNESPLFTDLTGDGIPEVVLGSQPEAQMGYLSVPDVTECAKPWKFVAISEPGDPAKNGTFRYYHGLGVGDVNNDGRNDVVIPHGWWEGPATHTGPWAFHPLSLSKQNKGDPLTASNIHVIDLDLDGDQDFVMSSAHGYGVWWFENAGAGSSEPFVYHLIDESFSQTHSLALVDLKGNGELALVTGKRFFAHMGPDPGEFDPVVMNYFEIKREAGKKPVFAKRNIAAGDNTGVGTQFQMADVDQNGKLDVVLSNKKGVNLLLQK